MSEFLVTVPAVDVPAFHDIFRELGGHVVVRPFEAVESSVRNDMHCLFMAVDGVLDLDGVGLLETLLGFFSTAFCSHFEPGLPGAKGAWFHQISHDGWGIIGLRWRGGLDGEASFKAIQIVPYQPKRGLGMK